VTEKIKATACVPWRLRGVDGGMARSKTLDFLQETFLSHFEDVSYGTDYGVGEAPFNRAAARNDAVKKVSHDRDHILVFTDADTYAPLWQVLSAVKAIEDGQTDLALAYNGKCMYMSTGLTRGYGDEGIFGPFPGGVYAIRKSTYEALGGYDEGFVGWGHEDIVFLWCAERIFGLGIGVFKEFGPMFKVDLHHSRWGHESQIADAPESSEGRLYLANSERRDKYFQLKEGDKEGFWKLRVEGALARHRQIENP
jgi:hypothetical protein